MYEIDFFLNYEHLLCIGSGESSSFNSVSDALFFPKSDFVLLFGEKSDVSEPKEECTSDSAFLLGEIVSLYSCSIINPRLPRLFSAVLSPLFLPYSRSLGILLFILLYGGFLLAEIVIGYFVAASPFPVPSSFCMYAMKVVLFLGLLDYDSWSDGNLGEPNASINFYSVAILEGSLSVS